MSSCRFSGAQNTGNANNNYYNVKTDSLTYDGLFNENYFRIAAKEKEFVNNVEISHAITQHPITKQTEKFIGILTKSKYDGVGITEQIDVSIAIDASSSMTYTMNQERTKKKIDIAKETAKRIVGQLNSEDRVAITYFGLQSSVYLPLTVKSEITKETIDKIKSIKCRGSTYYYNGLKGAYDQLEKSTSRNKRIILLTDGGNKVEETKYKKYFESIKSSNI